MFALHRIVTTALAGFAVVATSAAWAPVAHAEGGSPALLNPAYGSAVQAGSQATVALDLSNTTPGANFALSVQCDSGLAWSTQFVSDGAPSTTFDLGQSWPATDTPCHAGVTNTDDQTTGFLGNWSVARALSLSNGRSNLSYFYPRVRDGFRDNVRLSWSATPEVGSEINVLNSAGSVVLSDATEATEYTWDGRNSNGAPVAAGNYRVKVIAEDPSFGNTKSLSIPVQVRTDVITKRRAATKDGSSASVSASRSCYATQDDEWDYTTSLDCWGGRYARARYTFSTPKSATGVRFSVKGSKTLADICCNGKIKKYGKRSKTKKSFAVTVQVNGWRAYEIRQVAMSYAYRVRR